MGSILRAFLSTRQREVLPQSRIDRKTPCPILRHPICHRAPTGERRKTLTTPNVLTEVSNLLPQGGLTEGVKRSLLHRFAEAVRFLEERDAPSRALSVHAQFAAFGLTDIAILEAALAQNCLIVTTDARFAAHLDRNKIDVVSFRLLRELNSD